MHTFKQVRDGDGYIWVVGHYETMADSDGNPYSEWNAMEDFTEQRLAAAYVNYLNGGEGNVR